jgi:hypothetical protein
MTMKTNVFLLTILLKFAIAMNGANAQSPVIVSSTGIGELKINMTLKDAEKITGRSISIKPTGEEGYATDTATLDYKGIQVALVFYNGGEGENNTLKKIYSISASHPSLQTRSGFTLGSDKFDIVKKLDGMHLTLQPDWRMTGKPDKAKYSVLMLTDGDNGTMLLMFFENNKLTGFEVTIDEGC